MWLFFLLVHLYLSSLIFQALLKCLVILVAWLGALGTQEGFLTGILCFSVWAGALAVIGISNYQTEDRFNQHLHLRPYFLQVWSTKIAQIFLCQEVGCVCVWVRVGWEVGAWGGVTCLVSISLTSWDGGCACISVDCSRNPGSVNVFCKVPIIIMFRLCRPHTVSVTCLFSFF